MVKNRMLSPVWFLELKITSFELFVALNRRINRTSSDNLERSLFKNTLYKKFVFFKAFEEGKYWIREKAVLNTESILCNEEEIISLIDTYLKETYGNEVMYGNDIVHNKKSIEINTRVMFDINKYQEENTPLNEFLDAFMIAGSREDKNDIVKSPEDKNLYMIKLFDFIFITFSFTYKGKILKNVYLRKLAKTKNTYEQMVLLVNYLKAGILKIED